MADKRLEEGFVQLGKDIGDLYAMFQNEKAHTTTEVDNIKKAILVLDNQSASIQVSMLDARVKELSRIVSKLVDVIEEVALDKKLIEPKKPAEKLREVIETVKEEVKVKQEIVGPKGYCMRCCDWTAAVDIEDKKKVVQGIEYIVSRCAVCGEKTFNKAK